MVLVELFLSDGLGEEVPPLFVFQDDGEVDDLLVLDTLLVTFPVFLRLLRAEFNVLTLPVVEKTFLLVDASLSQSFVVPVDLSLTPSVKLDPLLSFQRFSTGLTITLDLCIFSSLF